MPGNWSTPSPSANGRGGRVRRVDIEEVEPEEERCLRLGRVTEVRNPAHRLRDRRFGGVLSGRYLDRLETLAEPRLTRAEVTGAEHREGPPAGVEEALGEGHLVVGELSLEIVDAMVLAPQPGEDRGEARVGDVERRVRLGEEVGFRGQSVERRRRARLAAIGAEVVGAQSVEADQQDVRPVLRAGRRGAAGRCLRPPASPTRAGSRRHSPRPRPRPTRPPRPAGGPSDRARPRPGRGEIALELGVVGHRDRRVGDARLGAVGAHRGAVAVAAVRGRQAERPERQDRPAAERHRPHHAVAGHCLDAPQA